jgi:ssDNA-binding Zn-finger/Zn-ribbon topoisomerase 1
MRTIKRSLDIPSPITHAENLCICSACVQCCSSLVPLMPTNTQKVKECEDKSIRDPPITSVDIACCEDGIHEMILRIQQERLSRVAIDDIDGLSRENSQKSPTDRYREGQTPSAYIPAANTPAVSLPAPSKHNPSSHFRGIRKSCPECAFSWADIHRKNECPKVRSTL